jgi:hypothetical protein
MSISKIIRQYTGIGTLLIILLIPRIVYAADLLAFLVAERNRAEVSYIGVRTITLQYPAARREQ